MNVQELITRMLFAMQKNKTPDGRPLNNNKDIYCHFERDFDAVARSTGTNTGIVFAECLDAVGQLARALRNVAEKALEEEPKVVEPKAAEPTRRGRRIVAANGAKKPGVGRTVVSKTTTKVARRGRPKGSKNKSKAARA